MSEVETKAIHRGNGNPYPVEMKNRYKELCINGKRDGQIRVVFRKEFPDEGMPDPTTFRAWRRRLRNENVLPAIKQADWSIELREQEEAIEEPLMTAFEYLTPELMTRLEDGDHKDREHMTFQELFDNVLRLGKAMLSHNDAKQRRNLMAETGLTGHQQILINIQNRAEKRKQAEERNGSSEGTVIDAEFRDI
jgi:hypothetical protein